VRTIKRLSVAEYAHTAKEVHPFKRGKRKTVRVVVNNDFTVNCKVKVIHDEIGPGTPGGDATPRTDILRNVEVSHGPIVNRNEVDQANVCATFETRPGAMFEITYTFTDSSTPLTVQKGAAGSSGKVIGKTNVPVSPGASMNVQVVAKQGGESASKTAKVTFGTGSADAACGTP
jgi:hypothetical protein